ncbi:hypothetical protein Tco_0555599 [Tanacetum coccineum]
MYMHCFRGRSLLLLVIVNIASLHFLLLEFIICIELHGGLFRLHSSILKSKEPTLQVVFDALKLTPFYNAFVIFADVPEIYMQDFWVTVSKHHSSLRFKLNGKSHTVNIDNFRDMLKICPKLLGQIFEEPPLEEEILSFIRDLGHTDYFMAKDQAIPRRDKMFWHYARDEFMFTIIRVISKHHDTQVYGAILPQYLTNQDMLESEAYKTYQAYATGEKTPKPKSIKKKADSESSPKTKLTQASKGKRIKTIAKGDKPAKKKQSVTKSKGLTVLSKVQMKELVVYQGFLTYESDDEQISWKSSEEEDDDEENMSEHEDDNDDEQTESDNDGDDFVHPKFSTHDDEAKQDEEVNEEDSFDPRVQTPSHVESTDDEDSDDVIQDANVEGDMINEEETHKEVEANVLYRDVNVNLEGRDTVMTDAILPNVQATQETEDTHVILTALINPEGQQQSSSVSSGFISNMLNPRPDTCIDSIFNLNTEATSLVDVSVTTIAELPLVFAITLPPPPTPLITHILKTLETKFSEFKQMNQFAKTFSSIPGIVDAYHANKMNEAVKTAV